MSPSQSIALSPRTVIGIYGLPAPSSSSCFHTCAADWVKAPDVMYFDAFPIRYSFLLFAGCRLGKREWISFFQSLPFESSDEEARRNLAVCQPLLWM